MCQVLEAEKHPMRWLHCRHEITMPADIGVCRYMHITFRMDFVPS